MLSSGPTSPKNYEIKIKDLKNDPNKDDKILSKKLNKFFWTDAYLILAEQEFENVFEDIYEPAFIDAIFLKNEALIDR